MGRRLTVSSRREITKKEAAEYSRASKKGRVAVLTSTFSLDAQSEKAHREIAKHGDPVAAVRLPNNRFWEVAGTEAAADVLVFRGRKPDENRTQTESTNGTAREQRSSPIVKAVKP